MLLVVRPVKRRACIIGGLEHKAGSPVRRRIGFSHVYLSNTSIAISTLASAGLISAPSDVMGNTVSAKIGDILCKVAEGVGKKIGEDLAQLHDEAFTYKFMEAGGCSSAFVAAQRTCAAAAAADAGGGDVEACVKATAALRTCMKSKAAFFKHYIAAMDEGLEEDEERGYSVEFEDGPIRRRRWWYNMRRK